MTAPFDIDAARALVASAPVNTPMACADCCPPARSRTAMAALLPAALDEISRLDGEKWRAYAASCSNCGQIYRDSAGREPIDLGICPVCDRDAKLAFARVEIIRLKALALEACNFASLAHQCPTCHSVDVDEPARVVEIRSEVDRG